MLINVNRMWPYNELGDDRFPAKQNQETDEMSEVRDQDRNVDENDWEERENEVIESSCDISKQKNQTCDKFVRLWQRGLEG